MERLIRVLEKVAHVCRGLMEVEQLIWNNNVLALNNLL